MIDQRPAYHLRSSARFINDPNGPIEWHGRYHLFYQCLPGGVPPTEQHWGPSSKKHWGHAVSTDLTTWRELSPALSPSYGGYDRDGCWSGSSVNDNGTATILYTAVQRTLDGGVREAIALARSEDPDLRTWQKHPQPVIAEPPTGLRPRGFRDPFVWREGSDWYLILGTGLPERGASVLLFRSRDLVVWGYEGVFCSEPSWLDDPLNSGDVWECPQFFSLRDTDVLLVSPDQPRSHRTLYFVGEQRDGVFVPATVDRLDLGADFYAAATMLDSKGRRLLWGWSREGTGDESQAAAGWAGTMTLPRVLSFAPDGSLTIAPVTEIERLRREHRRVLGLDLGNDSAGVELPVRGEQVELAASFKTGTARQIGLRVRVSPNAQEATTILYDRAEGRLSIDRTRSSLSSDAVRSVDGGSLSLAPHDLLRLHVFLDHSIVEVYANDRRAITERIYPTLPSSQRICVFALGGEARLLAMDTWQMAKA